MSYKDVNLPKNPPAGTDNAGSALSRVGLMSFAVTVLFTVTLCSCSTCDTDVTWIKSLYGRQPEICNPNFIFDNTPTYAGMPQVSAEDFYRTPWPAAPMMYGTISSGETMSYHEKYFSEQYQDGQSRPRNRFHSRVYGYRREQYYR